ncbi:putative NEDD8-activating enzyme E1 catalytic subunit [Blattamonas nauphoetae]|uniref:NEDD8-activating enzyme E1 catalytic subunit n=1 Tax=Blattamonas nauphoetae TaxID=2049346 RepID=A0ABQ9YMA7_9EUKA|nr:putative NEDD8-activating enzyme E1 catalytic subunit [Blattamonas nauphoetae]
MSQIHIQQKRFDPIYKQIEHASKYTEEADLSPEEIKDYLHTRKILVVGAGGLGCEVLKGLALSGFSDIHVIDLDTIDISNLNRQFLFTQEDAGKTKSEVAAAFVNRRVKGVKVVPYVGNIMDQPLDWYKTFDIVIAGLDNVEARRWLNATLVNLARNDIMIPMLDGGSEGLFGQARVIIPQMTACYECTMWTVTPEVTFPVCTIASNPRIPAHCVQYAIMHFPESHDGRKCDGDRDDDVDWCLNVAQERAKQFNIEGVDYKLTLGVIKNVIPALASTNSIIAALCVNEALKLAMNLTFMKHYLRYSGSEGINVQPLEMEMNPDCIVCGGAEISLDVGEDETLGNLIDRLKQDETLQLKNPFVIFNGNAVYNSKLPFTEPNLEKTCLSLFGKHAELTVSDKFMPDDQFLRVKIKVGPG